MNNIFLFEWLSTPSLTPASSMAEWWQEGQWDAPQVQIIATIVHPKPY